MMLQAIFIFNMEKKTGLSIIQPKIAFSLLLLKALANYWCKDSIYFL